MADRPLADAKLLAESIRALQREMSGGFEAIGRALTALDRIEDRLAVVADHQHVLEKRIDDHERRIAALEGRRRTKKR